MPRQHSFTVVLLLAGLVALNQASGCGPEFPNWLLAEGDRAVLVAPGGDFAAELARMQLGRPRLHALPPERPGGHSAQSAEAELADLRKALKQARTPEADASLICSEHQRQRHLLAESIDAKHAWDDAHSDTSDALTTGDGAPQTARPAFPNVTVTQGLPAEFADYFEGFITWHNPAILDKQMARTAWERLLARPETERRYKSTWAAFMLGKSWEKADPEKAISYFKQVRDLARQGYGDSVGLGAASLGLEARLRLKQGEFEAAIETYLDQMAAGDPTATNSLNTAAAKALTSGPDTLLRLAKNPRTQKVITAYVISLPLTDPPYVSEPSESEARPAPGDSPTAKWLTAAEEAGIKDMDSGEALALAAYRANDMDKASRWIKRAPGSPLAQWLQAKLLLRAGKLNNAAVLLARISSQFPIIHEGTDAPAPIDRKDTLTVNGNVYSYYRTSAERQVHGELGVLRLSRGEYAQALDSLLNAGFWMDAAYVAERVLTLDELKGYVDQFWPAATAEQADDDRTRFAGSEVCPATLREQIRYLLARRLTRELRGAEAREYYPVAWLSAFDQLLATLRAGWDETLDPSNRATALLEAALITRTNGMELIGTEVAPDWHYHRGDFDYGVTGEERGSNALAVVVRPLKDELRRNARHLPDPDERFHYRYQAASLAWEAAKLLPDNNDQTAYILWQGGTFLKARDPETADLFYKALVRRNPQTALGAEADRQRWFPTLDEDGNIVPRKSDKEELSEESEARLIPVPEVPVNTEPQSEIIFLPPSEEIPVERGYKYILQRGDSLPKILLTCTRAGVSISREELLAANPELNPARLKVGQVVFIPAKDQ